MPYATSSDVRLKGVLIPADVDRVEARFPGITAARLATAHARLNARLQKRYRLPFLTPVPECLVWWEAVVVSYELLTDLRGLNPESGQGPRLEQAYQEAKEWLTAAVDSEHGDVELRSAEAPLGAAAVNAGGPLGYSELSPYTWSDVQIEALRGGGG